MTPLRTPIAILTGGNNAAHIERCCEVISAHNVQVDLIISTDKSDHDIGELTRKLTREDAPLFFSRRPWLDPEITSILEQGIPLAINIGFDYIIDKALLDFFERGMLNMHPAYLPLNKGCHHSFWGIMEQTPFGATLHWVTPELDAGDIIGKEAFYDDGFMTAEEIQLRSEALCVKLLDEYLESVLDGTAPREPQEGGTYHSKKEIVAASTLRCGDSISVDKLLDLCRATSCKGNGFYVIRNGRKVLVRTTIEVMPEQ